jgi:hypothetical protein
MANFGPKFPSFLTSQATHFLATVIFQLPLAIHSHFGQFMEHIFWVGKEGKGNNPSMTTKIPAKSAKWASDKGKNMG